MFETMLREMTLVMAQMHASIARFRTLLNLPLDDKGLHFVIMALLAMLLFVVVHALFSRLAQWSITAISFIYVFTIMVVFGFAIEIGQRITGTGNMEFGDVVAGLYGVLAFFAVYTAYRVLLMIIGHVLRAVRKKRKV